MNQSLKKMISEQYPKVSIVLASKYLESKEAFLPFIEAGQTDFGENRAEVIEEKQAWLTDYDVTWHYIGTLQTKKVKKIINDIDFLHALDRLKLAKEIEKRREGVLPCYIQVNISEESQKHGLAPDAVAAFMASIADFEHIKVIGLMGMARDNASEAVIRKQFQTLRHLRDALQKKYPDIQGLSMGMSQDYLIALEEGATVLRLGRIMLTEGYHGT